MRKFPLLAPALILAACGQQQGDTPAATETPPRVTADLEGSTPLPRAPDTAAAIPARFHGVWDAETGTCDPASDLRLEVGPREVGFYESHGAVTKVAEPGDGSAAVTMAMEGEGERWTATFHLALVDSGAGERLTVRHDDGRPATPILKLERCPV
ncbi:hypothetical protein [Erythrobacter sp. WG]|uniref:hypothetical protein n=1 Tax=Erythrobacter sp. WG TaxID=2985510 RepID=UPI00226E60BB|nr:hypothetical protein [Erythrobacter sp. WG]MCX9146095.1 hypothetical protein [Erythrobacter sp. WG]